MGSLSGACVLVTGAGGFIGTHLVNRLRAEKLARLVLLSRRPIETSGAEVSVTSDLADLSSSTWRDASLEAFDVVFHLGTAWPGGSHRNPSPAEVVRSGVVGTQSVLESLQGRPCRFVFASSVDVFAPSEGLVDESSPISNTSLYAASKLMGESLVSLWASQSGNSAVIARVGHVYGPGEGANGKAIPTFIRAALGDRPLLIYGDGSTERDLLYVRDVVEALIRVSTASSSDQSMVVILAASTSTTVLELAQKIVEIVGSGSLEFARDRNAGYSTRFNTQKMKQLIGDWDAVSLSGGLRAEVESFKREGVQT